MFHDKNHLCGQFCTNVSLCHLSLTGATSLTTILQWKLHRAKTVYG